MTEHINRQFDQDLAAIRSRMMRMGGLVESHIRSAVAGFVDGDLQQALDVIAGDARVNDLELEIDNEVGNVIVRRQPAASDLRLLLAASKIVTDLERVGDEAAKVARIAKDAAGDAAPPAGLPDVRPLATISLAMLNRALDAFARLDAVAAARICAEDAAIDAEFRGIFQAAIAAVNERPQAIAPALRVVWVAKAFERIGDHARNIAEHVIFIVRGSDVRHIPLAQLEREALGR